MADGAHCRSSCDRVVCVLDPGDDLISVAHLRELEALLTSEVPELATLMEKALYVPPNGSFTLWHAFLPWVSLCKALAKEREGMEHKSARVLEILKIKDGRIATLEKAQCCHCASVCSPYTF